MKHRIPSLAIAALLPLALAQVATAQAPTPGERWRTTMSMEAMGMKMPGMTQEICAPKGQPDEPPPANPDCTQTNMRRNGKTMIFDMQCKDGTTGTMEMTQESPTRWSSKMLANTKEGQMTMLMNSEKLPGECDASAMERKMNKLIAEGNAANAKACMENARGLNSQMFIGANAGCKDKASVDAFCTQAKGMKGYNTIARQQRMSTGRYGANAPPAYRTVLADTGKLCGFSPEATRKQHCSTAQTRKEWTFFAEECPETANPIGQRECAGRDFTNPVAPAYADFCSAWSSAMRGNAPAGRASGSDGESGDAASNGGASGSSTASGSQGTVQPDTGSGDGSQGDKPKPTDAAKEALKKSRDALKGLFGR